MNLNHEQKLACQANLGYNLVIASAGTGKTSTIVGRLAHLLESGLKPEQILLLTFTNKASKEMISRVGAIFGKETSSRIESGTFHSVAYRYLKKRENILLKQPRELKLLLKTIYDRYNFGDYDPECDEKPYSYQYLYDSYSLFSNSIINGSYAEWLEANRPNQAPFAHIYENLFEEFNELKRSYGYADYNDLLILYREALEKLDSLPYIEVLCDEYQDTNPLQNSVIQALRPQSLFCVGDYDQSIYAFNGADISIITNFTEAHPGAKVFSLSKNYRSTELILDLAGKVIKNNPRIYPKSLEVVRTSQSIAPVLLKYEELNQQYKGLAERIVGLRKSGIAYDDIAVIYRNNTSADGIQAALRSLGVDSKRKGGSNFFDNKDISFLLCLCGVIANDRDMMSYINILSHASGLGSATAKEIFDSLLVAGEGDCKRGLLSPNAEIDCYPPKGGAGLFDEEFRKAGRERFDSLLHDDFKSHPLLGHPKLSKEAALFINDFFLACKQNANINNPSVLLSRLIESRFYENYLRERIKERSKTKDGRIDPKLAQKTKEKIQARLHTLLNLAKNYRDVASFLNITMLDSGEMAEGEGVQLLSIHASKGLEFSCVFLIDLMEGRFPNTQLISKNGGGIEEERRLFYVACTRAKDRLYLSYARRDDYKGANYFPSLFLAEGGLVSAKECIPPKRRGDRALRKAN